MSFELLPTVTPWVVAILAVAVLGVALLVGGLATGLLRNRRVRVARHESIPAYYGRLALGH